MTLIENKLSECGIKANNMRFSEFPTYKMMAYNIFVKLCKNRKSTEMLSGTLSPLIKSIALRLLKERNIVHSFTENYYNGDGFKKNHGKAAQAVAFIETAFVWSETKEDYDVWREINKDFDDKLHFIMNHDFNI